MTTTLLPDTVSRPNLAAPDQPSPRRLAWQHGGGKDLIADPGRLILQPPPPPDALPCTALTDLVAGADATGAGEAAAWAAATAYALRAGVLPTRWDDWSGHNAHRPFPSPRAKQAHAIEVRIPRGAYAVDEVRGTLLPAGRGGAPAIIVRTRPDRIPEGYGRMRIALSLLEIGHIIGELTSWLSACGRRSAYAVCQLGPLDVAVVLTHRADPDRRPASGLAGSLGSGAAPLPARPRRCSGLDVRGLSPDPRPLDRTAFDSLLAAAPVSDDILRHRLAVRGIADTPAGVADATPAGLRFVAGHDAHQPIARAIRGPRGVLDVDRMNVLWGIASPLTDRLREAADYPRLLVRVGAAAQDVCRAAAAAGLFARPVRGIDEPDVEAALQLPADEDLLYLLLIGRPRVHGFTYDLSPATPPTHEPPGRTHDRTDTAYRKDTRP